MKVRRVGVRRVWDCMLCAYMDRGEDAEETPSLLSYTLRYISFTEVSSVCRVPLREPIHLFTYMSEEGV